MASNMKSDSFVPSLPYYTLRPRVSSTKCQFLIIIAAFIVTVISVILSVSRVIYIPSCVYS